MSRARSRWRWDIIQEFYWPYRRMIFFRWLWLFMHPRWWPGVALSWIGWWMRDSRRPRARRLSARFLSR